MFSSTLPRGCLESHHMLLLPLLWCLFVILLGNATHLLWGQWQEVCGHHGFTLLKRIVGFAALLPVRCQDDQPQINCCPISGVARYQLTAPSSAVPNVSFLLQWFRFWPLRLSAYFAERFVVAEAGLMEWWSDTSGWWREAGLCNGLKI